MKNASKKQPAHAAGRRGRPLRALFGLLSAGLGAAALVAALSPVDNRYGLPPVDETTKMGLLAYGAVMFVLALWAIGTSGPRKAKGEDKAPAEVAEELLAPAPAAAERAPSPAPASVDLTAVAPEIVPALRDHGWYVAKDVALPHADADYVAVGPAGVLVVQRMISNAPDPRGRASIRARVAGQQLEKLLRQKEVAVDVVPAVVAYGPGQDDQVAGGVRIVDNVAILFADRADEWFPALTEKQHIPLEAQRAVADIIGDILEGIEPAIAGERVPASV